jgi:hypothetical protein
MYTRSYYQENEKITVPENYDGNAFRDDYASENKTQKPPEPQHTEELRAPWDIKAKENANPEAEPTVAKIQENKSISTSIFKKIPFIDRLGGFNFFDGAFKFGTEEILIIGVALFLIFSKSADIECAIMLLLLLFIK